MKNSGAIVMKTWIEIDLVNIDGKFLFSIKYKSFYFCPKNVVVFKKINFNHLVESDDLFFRDYHN